MSKHQFTGQHSDEIVLYEVRPHDLALYTRISLSIFAAVIVFVLSLALTSIDQRISLVGLLLAGAIGALGSWLSIFQHRGSVAYLTDRRMVRFESPHPLHNASRTLSWDDVMKVKTFPPNFIWSLLNIGTVVLHARASIVSVQHESIQKEIAGDDLELKDVWYYKDIGHYIDKILYTVKRNPDELKTFRPFIPKPKGERY